MAADYTPATSVAPVACTLTGAEQAARGGAFAHELEEVRELPDGYALRYAADPAIIAGLFDAIMAERACCPFFTFELVFAPDAGPLRLRLRGPEGAKEVARLLIGR